MKTNNKFGLVASAVATLVFSLSSATVAAQSSPGGRDSAVYPGGVKPAASAPSAQSGKVSASGAPGAPGTPISGAPVLPPLPGAVAGAPASGAPTAAAQLAVDDTLPEHMAAQIKEFKRRLDMVDRANAESTAIVAKPVTRATTITQAAGEESPVVRVAPAIPTNIVFIDSTGQPWPIDYAIPGDPTKFEILMPNPGTSVLQIRPTQSYGYGGLSVMLKGNTVPVTLILTAGQEEVDARLDVKIARRGPNAAASIIDLTGQPHDTDVSLSSFMDGVPPPGSQEVKTSLKLVRAWLWAGKLVIRSELPLISPAWKDNSISPNGVTFGYILPVVPSILVSSEGRFINVQINN